MDREELIRKYLGENETLLVETLEMLTGKIKSLKELFTSKPTSPITSSCCWRRVSSSRTGITSNTCNNIKFFAIIYKAIATPLPKPINWNGKAPESFCQYNNQY